MSVFASEVNTQLVGLSGTFSSGKDYAAEHLVTRHGFMHVSSGDVLRDVARSKGLGLDRPTLVEVGVQLREAYGTAGAIVLKAIEGWEKVRAQYLGGLLVSGLRVVGEAQEIKDQDGTLVFTDAPVHDRHQRMVARNRDHEATKSLEQFIEDERVELYGLGGPNRPYLIGVEAISDAVIQNSIVEEELFLGRLDEVLGLAH